MNVLIEMPELILQAGSQREKISLDEAYYMLMSHPHEYFRTHRSLVKWRPGSHAAMIRITSEDAKKDAWQVGYYLLECKSFQKAIAKLDEIRASG